MNLKSSEFFARESCSRFEISKNQSIWYCPPPHLTCPPPYFQAHSHRTLAGKTFDFVNLQRRRTDEECIGVLASPCASAECCYSAACPYPVPWQVSLFLLKLPAKLLDYYLRSNNSNINQYIVLSSLSWVFTIYS